MRALITGGAGFLGSALANYLAEAGHHVRVLEDLSSGDTSHLHAQVYFERGIIRDLPRPWAPLRNVECVYHAEAVARS